MKKQARQLLCAALILFMLAGFAPAKVQADTTKEQYVIHTLAQGKWVTVPKSDEKFHVYKITVPASGYTRLFFNRSKCKYPGRATLDIYKTYDVLNENVGCFEDTIQDTTYITLPKGTYYLSADSNAKIKWNFQKKAHASNYCMAKAATQKAGKNETVHFDLGYEFPKYYKVKLSQKQKIRVFTNVLDNFGGRKARRYRWIPKTTVKVLNSEGQSLKTTQLSENTLTTDALPKGTYYIRLERDTVDEDASGQFRYLYSRIISFTWNAR